MTTLVQEKLGQLPPKRRAGTTRRHLIAWCCEEVAVPPFMKEAYGIYVERHFVNGKTVQQKKKESMDRISWLIRCHYIFGSDPDLKLDERVNQLKFPSFRTLCRFQKWAKTKKSVGIPSPAIHTLDKIFDIFGYEEIGPRIQRNFIEMFSHCKTVAGKIEGLHDIGQAFKISKSVYSYYQSISNPEMCKEFLMHSYCESLFPAMDVLHFEIVKLKSH